MSDENAAPGEGGGGTPPLRIALWALMVATVVAIVLLAVVNVLRDRTAAGAPPVLGEVPPFELTGSDGEPVRRADLAGLPYVVDFVFTRCVTSCPLMTSQMQTVGEGLSEGRDFRRVSISVDPAYDTPEVLQAFEESRGLPASWWFLTGEPDRVLGLIRDGFHLVAEPTTGNAIEPIAHSTRFVLVDGEHRIRGYYDGLVADEVGRLDRDLRRLVRRAP
jgi:protein SCO1/2